MLEKGTLVTAKRAGYNGRIIARAGEDNFVYYTDGQNPAVPVYSVENTATGEVRLFREDALEVRQ